MMRWLHERTEFVTLSPPDRSSLVGGGIIQMHQLLAYIDPGSGSLIIQAVIATAVAIPIFFRTQIGRLLSNLRGAKASEGSSDGTDRAA
jgi:hypothetical protein